IGNLTGHITLGIKRFKDMVTKHNIVLPEEIMMRLEHIILSHHGKLEWGSPVTPQTIEANIVHFADYVDSVLWKWDREVSSAEESWIRSRELGRIFVGYMDENGDG